MGSSSKKQKGKESRKRRHRSRSNSEESTREKERHRHRKHHKERRHEKRHREYEDEGPPTIQSPIQIDSPSPTREASPPAEGSADSLSVDETNKLRAKLGLKPLELKSDAADAKDGKYKDDLGEFYHKPAASLKEKAHQEKIRARLAERKEKRKIESKLSRVITLGDSDSEDDAESWVERNRRQQAEKEQAAKRARMLEELDQEFGVGDIVESETKFKRSRIYTDKHLRGLKVEHSAENFEEGKVVVLTLKDQDVLAEDADVLVNVNLIDEERYQKSNDHKKKKPGYVAYEEEFDKHGNPIEKSLLGKYDEEIDGVKKSSFTIGEDVAERKRSIALSIRQKLSNKRIESLVLPELNLASEYYTEEEMTKFKKPKKKVRKIRQKGKVLTAAELAAQLAAEEAPSDHGSRNRKPAAADEPRKTGEMTEWMDIDDVPDVKPMDIKLELDANFEKSLRKARRVKQKEALAALPSVSALMKQEPDEAPSAEAGSIVLNSTAEFCRTLGDIPTYGRSGNRDEDEKDLMEFDADVSKAESMDEDAKVSVPANAWNAVEPGDVEVPVLKAEVPILDEEPDVGSGVGAALKLAMSKGYLDKEENNRPSTSRFSHLQAKHYSIEDKTYGDDDKFGQRRERYNGPTMDFKEKETFKPNVKLEYIDDDGRVLNPKEAFRYLSHKFHGKGPGKNKIEKRIKKTEQEGLMKKMSSTDTPLGTLNMLQHKQKEVQSPYIVLSGSKHLNATSISKARR